jgi:hypothetical protein
MLTQEAINQTVARICLMPFFPSSDSGARAVVAKEIVNMANSDEQVIWLGYRFVQLYPKQWPGIGELRALFCTRFKPADGFQINSGVFEEFPSEAQLGPVPGLYLPPAPSEREAIEAASIPPTRQLEAGKVSVDLELAAMVHEIAESHRMPPSRDPRSIHEIEQELYQAQNRPQRFEAREKTPQIITAEEVEAARAEELLRRQQRDAG